MTLSADTYLEHLRNYVNDDYVIHNGSESKVVLKETYFEEGDDELKERNITLLLSGVGMAFKLDKDDFEMPKKRSRKKAKSETSAKQGKPALFHFLDDQAKPWSKRCDFVVFRTYNRSFFADCIEFKTKFLNADKIVPQLKAGVCWCRSLKHTIEHYTGDKRKIKIRKFVFGTNKSPGNFVNTSGQFKADPSIRYYHFDEVNGQPIDTLENTSVLEI